MNLHVSLIIVLSFLNLCLCEKRPELKISNGVLKGTTLKSRGGKSYSAFLGIPYAKFIKRFQLAEDPESWEGIRDASKYGEMCIQKLPFFVKELKIEGSEDCLFVNVFTPKLNGKLPVMVFIHGGGFQFGSSYEYGADYFMDQDVILVTLNYRLGPLGFLSTGDGVAEANLGLKDQLMALKWVQKNIDSFGGDDTKVTLFGESAGSASVHFHILSPLSKGLFQRAILQSGSSLNTWSFMEKPEKFALALAKGLGCSTDNSKDLLNCLEKENVENILKYDLTEWYVDPVVPFAPSYDIPGKSRLVFLSENPLQVLKSGEFNKIPVIFTLCEDEGLLFHSLAVSLSDELRKDMNENFQEVFPITLLFNNKGYSLSDLMWISSRIKQFYFGTQEVGPFTLQNLTNMYSDRHFVHGVEKSLMYHAKHGAPVFNAILAHKGEYSHTSLLGIKNVMGVSHADDLIYLFKLPSFPTPLNPPDEIASQYFVNAWVKFATTGNPEVKWNKVSWDPVNFKKAEKNGPSWLQIKLPPQILKNPFKARTEFWDKVFYKADLLRTKEEL